MRNHNNKILSVALLILTSLFILNPAMANKASPVTPYNKIVFFGDSLTDNGNIYSVDLGFLPKSPPYYQGRFSNDAVWSEHVSKYFSSHQVIADNYAFGGLTAILHNPIDGFLPYTLTASMYDYLARSLFRDRSTTLFIIWVGSNDYLQGSNNVDQATADVTANIKYVIEYLIYYGGSNFLVINLPDLSKTPYSNEKNLNKIFNELVQSHNKKLSTIVDEIQNSYKQVNIHLFDSNKLLVDSLANLDATNKKYNTHIKNITEACWQGGYTLRNEAEEQPINATTIQRDLEEHMNAQFRSKAFLPTPAKNLNTKGFAQYIANSPSLSETYSIDKRVNEFGQRLKPCAEPNDYAFWDRIHPSGAIHAIFAQNMIEFIETNYQHEIKA